MFRIYQIKLFCLCIEYNRKYHCIIVNFQWHSVFQKIYCREHLYLQMLCACLRVMSSSVGIKSIMLLFVLKLFFHIMKPMLCCYYFSAFCFLNTIAPIYHRRYAIFLSCSSFLFHSRYCFIFLFLSEWSKISFDLFIIFFFSHCSLLCIFFPFHIKY